MTKRSTSTTTLRTFRRIALVALVGLTAGACGGSKDKTQGAVAASPSTTSATAAPTTTSTDVTTTTMAGPSTTNTSATSPTTVTTKPSAKTQAVTIKLYAFDPNPIHVPVGTIVTWTNQDEILHTVTSGVRTYDDQHLAKDVTPGPPGFDFMLDGKGTKASYTFATAGTYSYLCTRHPGMDAQIVVG